jgi:hypothetical protein
MRALLPVANHESRVGKWLGRCGLAGLLVAVGALQAAPRVEADPNKDYRITPEVGPFVVCAAAYKGPTAETLAKQLVLQLRQRDGLPAWYFDRGADERRQQEEHLNQFREKAGPDARLRMHRIEDQYAVLIGGYSDMDSARRVLNAVKKLKMPDFKLRSDQSPYDTTVDPQTGQILAISPFAHAFVTRNPSLPHNQQQEKQDDPFLKELNADEAYSLLQCKKPYTLAVKAYQGISVTKSGSGSFLAKVGLGRKSNDTLSASALQAHELAKLLREHLKLEAYVLHDRRCSYVTVGGYDGLDDPEMQQMQQRLASLSFKPGPNAAPGAVDVLQLVSPAIPMRVPRP